MRIVGEIHHPSLKITVFKNDGRFSVKAEFGLIEQIFKFRDDPRLETFDDVAKVVDPIFIQEIEEIFKTMLAARHNALHRNLRELEEEFDTII